MERSIFSMAAVAALLVSGCASRGSDTEPRLGRISASASRAEREAYYQRAEARVEGLSTWVGKEPYTDLAIRQHYLNFKSSNAALYARQANSQAKGATLSTWLPPVIGLGAGAIVGLIWAAIESLSNTMSSYSYYGQNQKTTDYPGHILIGAGAGVGLLGLTIALPLSLSKAGGARAQREKAADTFNRDLQEALKLD